MNVFELFAKISLDSSEYDKQLDQAKNSAESSGSKIGNAFKTAGKVAGTMLTVSTGAVAAFGKSSVEAGAEFDSSMSQVAATMGKSMEEFNSITASTTVGTKEFTGTLRDFAQYMGSTTAFSATEAADALNYMALAGYDAKTSMDMLPTVLNLAAAGSIDLANASDMVTDAQTALGLDLGQTRDMVDQMAKTASKSNTSVEQLGEAFLTIGANAKSLSGGTVELSQVLGVLADNGIKGSEAGTHLRNIMLAMNPTTDKAANAWAELGVSAYDAQGNLRPLQDTFADLNKAMADMSDQQRSDTLTAMFNKTDLAAIGALLETDTSKYNALKAAIDDSAGAAEKMAETQLDNLAGDITLFQSALEGAKIAVSDKLTPAIREFVKLGGEGLQEMTGFIQKGDIQGAFGVLGDYLGQAISQMMSKLPDIIAAGFELTRSLGSAILEGLMENLPDMAETGFNLITSLGESIMTNLPVIAEKGAEMLRSIGEGLVTAVPEFLQNALPVILNFSTMLRENVGLLVDAGIDMILGLAKGLADGLPALIENVPTIVTNIAGLINDNMPKIIEAGIKIIITLGKGLIQAIPTIVQNIPEIIMAIVNVFLAFNWLNLGKTIITGLKDGIMSMVSAVKGSASNIVSNIKNVFSNFSLRDIGVNLIKGLWEGIKSMGGWIGGNVKSFLGGLAGKAKNALGIHSPSKVFAEIGEYCVEGFENGLEGLSDVQQISELGSSVDDISKSAMSNASTNNVESSATGSGSMSEVIALLQRIANKELAVSPAGLLTIVREQNDIFKVANGGVGAL